MANLPRQAEIEKPVEKIATRTEKKTPPRRRGGGKPRPNVVATAEAEFGEPMLDILRGLAAQGASRAEAARAVGYATEQALRALIKRRGWSVDWPNVADVNRRNTLAAHADGLIHTPAARAAIGAATKARTKHYSHDGRSMALTDWLREAGQPTDDSNVQRAYGRVKRRMAAGVGFWEALTG